MGVYDYSRGNGHLYAKIPVAFGIYCMVVDAITTVDQLAAHITAGCEKGDQHGTE